MVVLVSLAACSGPNLCPTNNANFVPGTGGTEARNRVVKTVGKQDKNGNFVKPNALHPSSKHAR